MKNKNAIFITVLVLVVSVAGFIHVYLSGPSEGWRPVYDTGMKWLNFGILVYILVRFGKDPIVNFFQGQKKELSEEIKSLEDEKKQCLESLKEVQERSKMAVVRANEIREKTVKQAKLEQERVIEKAKKQSAMMIEESKKKSGLQLVQARQKFKEELVDLAVDIATKQLPDIITEEDNLGLLRKYLESSGQFTYKQI